MRGLRVFTGVLLLALTVAAPVPSGAEIRITDLDVFLNDHEVTVRVVVLDAVPPAFLESLQSGVPTHLRFTLELWRYNRLWRDRLITTRQVDRQLEYNVVTKEYKVASLRGEQRAPYTTRDVRDAERALAEVRAVKLAPATILDSTDVFYVRVLVQTALWGEHTWVARVTGTAEQTARRSDYRTIMRAE